MFFEICAHRVDKFHHILWDRRMPFHLNSGDWVESLTALVENEQGEWNIVSYNREGYTADEMLPSCLHYAEVI